MVTRRGFVYRLGHAAAAIPVLTEAALARRALTGAHVAFTAPYQVPAHVRGPGRRGPGARSPRGSCPADRRICGGCEAPGSGGRESPGTSAIQTTPHRLSLPSRMFPGWSRTCRPRQCSWSTKRTFTLVTARNSRARLSTLGPVRTSSSHGHSPSFTGWRDSASGSPVRSRSSSGVLSRCAIW